MRSSVIILGLILPVLAQQNNGDHTTLVKNFIRNDRKKPQNDCIPIDYLEDCILKHPLGGCTLCTPTFLPTDQPSDQPSVYSEQPTVQPTSQPTTSQPIDQPTVQPTSTQSTSQPTATATQSCHAENHGELWVSYSILIGVPFGGKSDCDATYHELEKSVDAGITIWQCVNENGNIRLWFNCIPGQGDKINRALGPRYPSVNSFNCPDQ